MKIPYSDKTNEELSLIYKDYVVSKNEGIRCESFVPYAKEIKENIAALQAEMMEAAQNLQFERAAELRDKIKQLDERING